MQQTIIIAIQHNGAVHIYNSLSADERRGFFLFSIMGRFLLLGGFLSFRCRASGWTGDRRSGCRLCCCGCLCCSSWRWCRCRLLRGIGRSISSRLILLCVGRGCRCCVGGWRVCRRRGETLGRFFIGEIDKFCGIGASGERQGHLCACRFFVVTRSLYLLVSQGQSAKVENVSAKVLID